MYYKWTKSPLSDPEKRNGGNTDQSTGTIPILRKQVLGYFLTHPSTMIYLLIMRKNFLNPLTQSSDYVIYEWSRRHQSRKLDESEIPDWIKAEMEESAAAEVKFIYLFCVLEGHKNMTKSSNSLEISSYFCGLLGIYIWILQLEMKPEKKKSTGSRSLTG